jgi:CheD chemotactic sensory transduction
MTLVAVGIGELAVSQHSGDELITYALGPCLGVVGYDSVRSIAGLVHCQLPLSLDDMAQAKLQPARYVDTGVTLLLGEMQKRGAQLSSIAICVAGGAQVTGGVEEWSGDQRRGHRWRTPTHAIDRSSNGERLCYEGPAQAALLSIIPRAVLVLVIPYSSGWMQRTERVFRLVTQEVCVFYVRFPTNPDRR